MLLALPPNQKGYLIGFFSFFCTAAVVTTGRGTGAVACFAASICDDQKSFTFSSQGRGSRYTITSGQGFGDTRVLRFYQARRFIRCATNGLRQTGNSLRRKMNGLLAAWAI